MLNHGGDLYSAKHIYEGQILDLSVNMNPLGAPDSVIQAAEQSLHHLGEYPDPLCRELREAIARADGVRPEQVFCGNGASEVIFRLAQTLHPQSALLLAPTFSEYEAALTQTGCDCRFFTLRREDNFDVTEEILEEIQEGTDLLLLCSPNNPTGRVIGKPLLEKILQKCEQVGAFLALDECFLPLTTGGESMAGLLKDHPRFFLLRAFTKTYSIAGLRLGYGLGDPALVERITANGPCWNVSGPAQAGGLACLKCPDWPQKGKAYLEEHRPILEEGLRSLGCEVIPSGVNYMLFRLPGVRDLKERLLNRGILIRSCADYRGLAADWYRAAVRSEEETERLLTAMRNEREETPW